MDEFNNVIGYDAIKKELMQISDVLKNIDAYKKLGVTPPRGLMLYGDPGVGKTLIVAIGNSLTYAKKLPADFAQLLIQNYRDFDKDYESFLYSVPEYTEYAAKRGRMRNGNVQ